MKIIGHRGAAGLAPENTVKAIKAGIAAGADAIEFDIRLTRDKKFIVMHDEDLLRTCGVNKKVSELTLKEIKAIKTNDGEAIPSFVDAVQACGKTEVFVELKGGSWANELTKQLPKNGHFLIISFDLPELAKFKKLNPNVRCGGLENRHPIRGLKFSKKHGFESFSPNHRLMNVFIYLLTVKYKMDIVTYTINSPRVAKFFHFLYPKLYITTNRPDLIRKALRGV